MTGSQGPFTYTYDPFDYRVHKQGPGVSAGYLLEGEHVETVTGSHQPAQFFRGVVIDEIVNGYQYDPDGTWTNYTYAHDSLQSVVGLTGHEGRTIQTTQYGPFGKEVDGAGASCSVLKYTGRERDAETGLYYYRARYYDPELGRFLTEDPLGFQAGVNFYAYVNNNPINANDPFGLRDFEIFGHTVQVEFSGTFGHVNVSNDLEGLGRDNFTVNGVAPPFSAGFGLDIKINPPSEEESFVSPFVGFGKNLSVGTNLINPESDSPRIQGINISIGASVGVPLGVVVPDAFSSSNPQQPSPNAAGGFLLYPNKPNLNMLQAVYSK